MTWLQPLVLLSALLTLCISAGSPEVWLQVQIEATELPSLSVRCGFLGSGFISLVTVSWAGLLGAGGTKLAVLHPELGTQQWAPACQAHWETQNSVSLALTLEQSQARSSLANTTFCCEFVIFPHGSRDACGDLHSSDQDLARILGASGVLLFGFIFILCFLCRQRLCSLSKFRPSLASTQTQKQAQAASQASLTTLHLPHATTTTLRLAALHTDTVHPDHHLPQWTALPTSSPHQPLMPVPPASPPASTHDSFISTENGLYAWAEEKLPHTAPAPNISSVTDPLEHSALERCLAAQ
ncbi:transmembrane protein PVRIG isoform X2 [Nannospalax galili]|uniref:transmembrane protein PVRIG isoform X2 n=1 Tax=Nannospalax galili TaxID=1026970 RepID=UPI0004ED1269|nr:transmembrane protein PVRIG isoform X2 [Nannospalax galili]